MPYWMRASSRMSSKSLTFLWFKIILHHLGNHDRITTYYNTRKQTNIKHDQRKASWITDIVSPMVSSGIMGLCTGSQIVLDDTIRSNPPTGAAATPNRFERSPSLSI